MYPTKETVLPTTKPKPKPTSKRKSQNHLVYFGCKAGNFIFQSKDKVARDLGDGRVTHQLIPQVKMLFGDKGVSKGFDPDVPQDAKMIKYVRDYIAQAEVEGYREPYDRVKYLNLREMKPASPPPPFSTWDSVDPGKLSDFVKDLKLDVEHCILYEEANQNRPDVVADLEALVEEDIEPDPLAIPVFDQEAS